MRCSLLTPLLSGFLVATNVLAAGFTEWQFSQSFEVSSRGTIKISLLPETLGVSRPDRSDLRIADAAGNEVPHLVFRPTPAAGRASRQARSFRVELQPGSTVITLQTGMEQAVGTLALETPADNFIKAVSVSGSTNQAQWEELVNGAPIFRQQNGAAQLAIKLPSGGWPYLRLIIDDRSSPPVPFTGAVVQAANPEAIATEVMNLAIQDRADEAGETRVVLDLGAAHLELSSIQISTPDPLFRRQAAVATRVVEDNTIRDRQIGSATIFRSSVPTRNVSETLTVPLNAQAESRELLLLIQNGDSPPLQIDSVTARRLPVYLVFYARSAGSYTLYSGNALAPRPQYDLRGLGTDLEQVPVSNVGISAVADNPGYRRPERLPEVQELGPVLDVAKWRFRKPVTLKAAGVQQLELDLEVLSAAQTDMADLRVMRGERQIPFVLERRAVSRPLKPQVSRADDPHERNVSRWLLRLPSSSIPLEKLQCTVTTPLFTREVAIYEEPLDDRGAKYRHDLGQASWIQTQDNLNRTFSVAIHSRPHTDALLLEVRNGDNPAIEISTFEFRWPVTRLLFKSSNTDPVHLYYSKAEVAAPRYDIGMVAGQLLRAEKQVVTLGPQEEVNPASWAKRQADEKAGWIFWGALGIVVVLLLVIISRLVPKEQPPPPPANHIDAMSGKH